MSNVVAFPRIGATDVRGRSVQHHFSQDDLRELAARNFHDSLLSKGYAPNVCERLTTQFLNDLADRTQAEVTVIMELG